MRKDSDGTRFREDDRPAEGRKSTVRCFASKLATPPPCPWLSHYCTPGWRAMSSPQACELRRWLRRVSPLCLQTIEGACHAGGDRLQSGSATEAESLKEGQRIPCSTADILYLTASSLVVVL